MYTDTDVGAVSDKHSGKQYNSDSSQHSDKMTKETKVTVLKAITVTTV